MVEHLGYLPSRWISNYAHIKADKICPRSKNEAAFLFLLIANTLRADLRWNKKISVATIRMLATWFVGYPNRQSVKT